MTDICVLSCFFSGTQNVLRQRNLERFIAGMEARDVPLFFVEAATGDKDFVLPPSRCVLRLRARQKLWHKERMLNLAVSKLPERFTKVIWADTDLLFDNDDWLAAASAALDTYTVIQPFDTAFRLGKDEDRPAGDAEPVRSFAAISGTTATHLSEGMEVHGHSGFAWGARRALWDHCGLFDVCLSGCGDHVMAHGFVGDTTSHCVRRHFIGAAAYQAAFERWSERAVKLTGGRVGVAPGGIRHLYHGAHSGSVYMKRNYALLLSDFDPGMDLVGGKEELWQIPQERAPLTQWRQDFFPE